MRKSGLLIQTKQGSFTRVPPPVFVTNLEAQRFYENEKILCREGWCGLSGRHYRYLTKGWVNKGRGGKDGKLEAPDFRVDDIAIFDEITRLDNGENDLIIYAGRGVGKTEFIREDLSYNLEMYVGGSQFVTAADVGRLKSVFTKFDEGINQLKRRHPKIRPVLTEMSNKVESGILRVYQTLKKDPYGGEPDWTTNLILGRQTSSKIEDVSNLSGSRGMRVTVEEPFLHKHLKPFLNTAEEIVKENGKRIGGMLLAGTLEYNSPPSCAETLQDLIIRSQKDESLRCIFLPYTHGKALNPDGTTNVALAMEDYEKECEKKSKLEDKTPLYEFIKNNPLKPEDVLKNNYTGAFTPDMYEEIEKKKEQIINSRSKIKIGVVKKEGFSLSTTGKIKILEDPIAGVPYISGIDPIEALNAPSTKGSQFVNIIYNPLSNTPAALYYERTTNDDKLAENSILLQSMYNNAKAMLEGDKGAVFIKNMKIRRRTDLLEKRPTKLGLYGKVAKGETVYGVKAARTQMAKDTIHQFLTNVLNRCIPNTEFKEIFDDIPNYPHANTDFLDALKMIAIYIAELEMKSPLRQLENVKVVTLKLPVFQGNRVVYVTKKIFVPK